MSTERIVFAALVVLLYAALCLGVVRRERRRRRAAEDEAAALLPAAADAAPVLVAFASQTGQAEALAWQTARALHAAGVPARLLPLDGVDAELLRSSERALFIASTYGEGDPPDGAAAFARRVMASAEPLPLQQLHCGVLALGDRSFAHFCGFGRTLDAWLQQQGATPLFERVEADSADPAALAEWRHRLSHLAGTSDLPDWDAPAFEPWRLAARRHLNPGSAGAPIFELELEPADGHALPAWEAGDLVQVQVAADPARPRDYSVASIPADGRIQLFVRRQIRADGTPGLASGWLTEGAALGDAIALRLRAHAGFRLGANAGRPLVLVGNGSGLAGLRGHLRALSRQRSRGHWLVFGERNARHDSWFADEVQAWKAEGTLARADIVFSRDQPERRYVQHALAGAADALRQAAAAGAAVYVCGSLEGMAPGVDAALAEALGAEQLQAMAEAGRYRRDVY